MLNRTCLLAATWECLWERYADSNHVGTGTHMTSCVGRTHRRWHGSAWGSIERNRQRPPESCWGSTNHSSLTPSPNLGWTERKNRQVESRMGGWADGRVRAAENKHASERRINANTTASVVQTFVCSHAQASNPPHERRACMSVNGLPVSRSSAPGRLHVACTCSHFSAFSVGSDARKTSLASAKAVESNRPSA